MSLRTIAGALGIILTGIGSDGAQGMKAMHDAGAHTLGQNKQSCAVYGMPAAAKQLGAVDEEGNVLQISKKMAMFFAKTCNKNINEEEI